MNYVSTPVFEEFEPFPTTKIESDIEVDSNVTWSYFVEYYEIIGAAVTSPPKDLSGLKNEPYI
jgi:hypothetical protein